MTVYASTASIEQPRELWELLRGFQAAEIEAVELGHVQLPDDTDLVERLRALPLNYLVHNYFPPSPDELVLNLASDDSTTARKSLEFVLAALELAAELGSPLYAVHSGFITDPVDFDGTSYILPPPASPSDGELAQARFLYALEKAVVRAEQLGVTLLIENSVCTKALRGKLLALHAEELVEIFERIESTRFGLLLDTGHLNVTAVTLGFDRDAFVDAVAPYVRAWHVHDNDGIVDSHLPIEPNSWVRELLRRPAFADLPVTVEARFPNVEELARHIAWLGGEVGVQRT